MNINARIPWFLAALALLNSGPAAWGAGLTGADVEEVVVSARKLALTGAPRAASEGTVLAAQLENRPLLRVGELLEVVPGLIVTQHTGDGKANQYFLRGFNLDHGTDFSTRVAGMPVNLPTHAHGQGYMDVNFVIPELVERIVYRKGTYYAELGDFSAAGAADLTYDSQRAPFLAVTAGGDGYVRTVAGGSMPVAGGDLLGAAEFDRTDGPWLLPEDLRKRNFVVRWSRRDAGSELAFDAMDYQGSWRATDQVPLRAVSAGTLGRFGFVDPSNGGSTRRRSLSTQGSERFGGGKLDFAAYAIDYRLQLFSNFTYNLDATHGDQFEQYDNRRILGGTLGWRQPFAIGATQAEWRAGIDLRRDRIAPVGLHLTQARARYRTVREDRVVQSLAGAWTAISAQWTPWLRSEVGVRIDRYGFRVASDLAANTGRGSASLASPKFSLALGPWKDTEFFVAAGRGFHSNDARGATTRVDPTDGVTPVDPVTPLAGARGREIGLRTAAFPHSQVSVALWQLDLASELLFIGDGGATEATRPSRRQGVELGVYARPREWLIVDADYAWSRARFVDADPAGARIPGAVESAASLGIAVDLPSGWFGGLRLRRLGAAALVEDDRVRSPASTLVNLDLGRRFGERWKATLGVYNLFNRAANDISYLYESQLPGEATPVEDLHFHPVEPRTVRVTMELRY